MANKFKIGQKILVRPEFGNGQPEVVTIEDFGEKNGQPVIDYVNADGEGFWAYEDQCRPM